MSKCSSEVNRQLDEYLRVFVGMFQEKIRQGRMNESKERLVWVLINLIMNTKDRRLL